MTFGTRFVFFRAFVLLSLTVAALLLNGTSVAFAQSVAGDFSLKWKVPEGVITSAAISPDASRVLLSADYDGYYLYNSNGSLLQRFPNPYEGLGAFSSDGKSILLARQFAENDDVITLYDSFTLRALWNFSLGRINYATLSGNGERIAIVGGSYLGLLGYAQRYLMVVDRKGSVLWNVTLGGTGGFDNPTPPAVSYDGSYVAVGDYRSDGGWFYFANIDTGKSWNFTASGGVFAVAVSADGSIIASADHEEIQAFDHNGHILWSVPLPDSPLSTSPQSFAVSDDGGYVAVAGGGIMVPGYVMLFDKNGRELWEYRSSTALLHLAVDWETMRLAFGDWQGNLFILNESGNVLAKQSFLSPVGRIAISPALMAAVVYGGGYGSGTTLYVMNSHTEILWRHDEIGPSDVAVTFDGSRVLAAYPGGTTILDENGQKLVTIQTTPSSRASALSLDGRVLVVSTTIEDATDQVILTWFNVTRNRLVQNMTLADARSLDSLSVSRDGSLMAVSGSGIGNFTFIDAFDSMGQLLWKHIDPIRYGSWNESIIENTVAVSADGRYVGAVRRDNVWDLSGHEHYPIVGDNNGASLFDNKGNLIWSYSMPDWPWNVAVSEDGEYVGVGGSTQLYMFNKTGRLLWNMTVNSGIIALSDNGQRFVAGHYGGGLFLGDTKGVHWQTGVDGHVQSVAISGNGEVVAALISREFRGAVPLLYLLDGRGHLLGNFTFSRSSIGQRMAVAENGCCIVVSSDYDGLYYFAKSTGENSTTNLTTNLSPTSILTYVMPMAVALIVAAGVTLLVIRKRRPRGDR